MEEHIKMSFVGECRSCKVAAGGKRSYLHFLPDGALSSFQVTSAEGDTVAPENIGRRARWELVIEFKEGNNQESGKHYSYIQAHHITGDWLDKSKAKGGE